jgi:hypothetical protein
MLANVDRDTGYITNINDIRQQEYTYLGGTSPLLKGRA